MYSFYGGQKGQDFHVSRIFANRSEELLHDLQARWYSPVNVGDYVYVNYGDIAEQEKYSVETNDEGQVEVISESKYAKNLALDLLNCGKSYSNSLWQKVYIDENKTMAPDLPDSDNNVYIFINFEDSAIWDEKHENIIGDSQGRPIDEYGNIVDDNGEIILLRQVPGQSLKECSDIYSEEHYGFGYRLIAQLTGQTPLLEAFHQTINIEDGDPYVTIDTSNLERPKLKFYQQRAQRVEEVKTIVLPPLDYPDVDLITNGIVITDDGEKHTATLTRPVLQVEIPRAVQFYSGLLFGKGNLSNYPYNVSGEENWNTPHTFVVSYDEMLILRSLALLLNDSLAKGGAWKSGTNEINVNLTKKYLLSKINEYVNLTHYYLGEKNNLINYLQLISNINDVPWNVYGLSKIDAQSSKYSNIEEYCKKASKEISDIINILNDYLIQIENNENYTLNLDGYWNKWGFLNKESFNHLLTLKDKKLYCKNYINGATKEGTFDLLINLFDLYTPALDLKQLLIDIFNTSSSVYSFDVTNNDFLHYMLSAVTKIVEHFEDVVKRGLAGDMYIHTPSGRLYQIIKTNYSDEKIKQYIKVKYIGILTAPTPQIERVLKKSFNYNTIKKGYELNEINIHENLLVSENQNKYREKYIFEIPKAPDFQVTLDPIPNGQKPSATLSIKQHPTKDDGIYSIDLSVPRAVHIYTDYYQPSSFNIGFLNTTDELPELLNKGSVEKTVYQGEVSADELCLGDIYIHTARISEPPGYDLSDERRGYVYVYTGGIEIDNVVKNGQWVRQGSILGPIGTPKMSEVNIYLHGYFYDLQLPDGVLAEPVNMNYEDKSFTFRTYAGDITEQGKLSDIIDYVFKEYINKDNTHNDLYPKSYLGEVVTITVYFANSIIDDPNTDEDDTKLSLKMSFWGQYNQTDEKDYWVTALITAQGAYLSSVKVTGDVAEHIAYTAKYLNKKIPEWDIRYYDVDYSTLAILGSAIIGTMTLGTGVN